MLESLTKQELIEQLHLTFGKVYRAGGVSWREAGAISVYRPKSECDAAKAEDTDATWLELAVDPDWNAFSCSDPWNFLEDTEFRYYLAAAIARDVIFDQGSLDPSFFCIRALYIGGRQIPPLERVFIANYVLYKAELPTRDALMDVLAEANMSYDHYLKSEESGWTPEPVWSAWQEPLEIWMQYLLPNQ